MKQVYRNLIFLCLFFFLVACLWHFCNLKVYLDLTMIKNNQHFLVAQIHNRPLFYGGLYIFIFFILTLSALPVTLTMATMGGFLFGSFAATIYSLSAILASSICAFKLSKKMFGNYVQEKYSQELYVFNMNFKKYGFYYLMLVRIVPIIPFFMVNLAAGLTHIDTKKFIVATILGALPIIGICSYLGSQCASLVVNW
ncbi:MAG: VTT domain-containing protein [Candidatus Babeliaceae bacterium]|nr:VTT domain-containing protein [Candidatus Babeliaceae bacterium]